MMAKTKRVLITTSFVLAGFVTPSAKAQLSNLSFEDLDPSQVNVPEDFRQPAFDIWAEFGNTGVPKNLRRNDELVNTGSFSCLIFGQFNDPFNAAGVYQDLPASPGDIFEASVFGGHVTGDELVLGNFAVLNIEFHSSTNGLIQFLGSNAVEAGDPTDVMVQTTAQSVAPDGTDFARLALVFVQPDPIFGAGAAHLDDASMMKVGEATVLENPSFEIEGGNCCGVIAMLNWAEFGRNDDNNIQRSSELVRTGELSAFIFGQFPTPPAENFTGITQSLLVVEGETVDAEVYGAHFDLDPLESGNTGFLNLEFLDAGGNVIGDIVANEFFDEFQPTNTWVLGQTSAEAPAGAVRVRMAMGLRQPGMGAGGIYFEDAALTITPAPVFCLGDANNDGVVNFADITSVLSTWLADYSPGTGIGDANGDSVVDFADITAVLSTWLDVCP